MPLLPCTPVWIDTTEGETAASTAWMSKAPLPGPVPEPELVAEDVAGDEARSAGALLGGARGAGGVASA